MAVGSCRIFLAIVLLAATHGAVAWGAMPELVGFVDLLTQADTASKLDLSDAQRSELIQLADDLEMQGTDVLFKASRLPADEQQSALRPFRLESQRKALAILSVEQRDKLSALLGESENSNYDPIAEVQGEQRASNSAPAAEEPAAESMSAAPSESGNQPAKVETADVGGASATADAPIEDSEATQPPAETPPARPTGDGKLTFNFRFQPWEDVLGWFADQADLSLVLDAPPSGTFNYRDSRRYSIGEALDVLNNVLQTKGYTLVRKDRMLLLINLEDEIPPNLVTDVDVDELDDHGAHELVRVLFQVRSMPSGDLAEELNAMVGPQGKIIVLSKANMIQVTETVGRIRAIRRVIESIDGPGDGDIRELALEHVMVDEALPIIRQMLGIASDALATPTGSLQLAVDPLGGKIFARGDAEEIARVKEVLRLVDVENSSLSGSAAVETPQLEVYSTGGIDSELVLKVLQTLLADAPGARIAADAATGNLVALARPSDHATIRATLAQMQQDVRQVEVIPLDHVEPTLAKLAVDRLFNTGTDEKPDPKAPIVEADLNSYSLIVRATPPQISEIKNLLNQLEESGTGALASGAGGTIRMVPLTGSAARGALAQVQQVWPAIRSNKIRIVTPSAESDIREYRPSGAADDRADAPAARGFGEPGMEDFFRWLDQGQGVLEEESPREPMPQDPSATAGRPSPFRFAAQQQPAAQTPTGPPTEFKTKSGATIIVAEGPGGLLLASEDTDALDEFEDLLRSAAGPTAGGRQFAVFYLKYAEAGAASEILGAVFGASGGGGSLMGDLAGGVMQDMGAGMMGDLLGLGGLGGSSAGFSSAAVDIVPDMRLNALIVYANPQDLDMVEQLLKIVDQRTGPASVEAGGRARMIVVEHSSAAAVAEVVKQVYADRLQGAGAGGGGGQPSPQDLMRMLQRGGRGGQGGGGSSIDQEPSKMSISVDTRSNSLIVRAPDPLFEEVAQLVKQLDAEGLETPQSTRVVSLQHTNASAVKEALESLLGPNAVTTNNNNNQPAANSNNDNNRGGNNNNNADEMRRRIEFFRNLQRAREGGGGGGGRGGRGGGRGGRGG
ncbi:Bacterial type II/III secretion system short domain protein [Posidoniimonas polymericola]|uniref:Bacterial type II/III secretion system short domain protein n=1 Tax=Posidoniimonas polymericola TaxID=2528002 RepID=A0A5C5XYR6_9BACT|nr:secretin N-terminal domain-containing protein [Posidoniimonas polymericola]TWT67679.1 Bacterial type II/III secretion system short domain protein [Posidoniimonas polymericola]